MQGLSEATCLLKTDIATLCDQVCKNKSSMNDANFGMLITSQRKLCFIVHVVVGFIFLCLVSLCIPYNNG